MTEITMGTDLSKLSKSDIENWLISNRSSLKNHLEDDKKIIPEEIWQPVATYLGVLIMQEDGMCTITSTIVNNIQWDIIKKTT